MRRATLGLRTAASTALFAALFAASPAANGVTLLEDLTSALKLLGLPCGQVVEAKRQAENDHIATCKDGTRYRVFVNAQGRVVAQKQ